MELAEQEYAARVVNLLIRSFPTQPSDPKTYASQLTTLCTGRPQAVLRAMVDPRDGLVAKAKFLPTVAEVREWLGKQPYGQPQIERKPEPKPELEITEEQRQRHIEGFQALLKKLRASTDMDRVRRKLPKPHKQSA